MPPVRRPAAAAPVANYVSFGVMEFYSGSRSLPGGLYAVEHQFQNFTPTKGDGTPAGPTRLVVMGFFHSIDEAGNFLGGDPHELPFGLGRKAHESFQPDAETGKHLVAVPGGPGMSPNKMCNWALYLESWYQVGLPVGILDNDLTALDGTWVRTDNVPEPEERKGFKSANDEVEQEGGRKGSGLVPVITEILEGGKPWEGGGGLPAEGQPTVPVAKTQTKVAAPARAAAKPVAAPAKTAAKAPAAGAVGADALLTPLTSAVADVFAANTDGIARLMLRTHAFTAMTEKFDPATANLAMKTYFANEASINRLIQPLGYQLDGDSVVPM